MATIDPAQMRTALEAERKRLLAELGEAIRAPGQMTYGSQAAAASQVFEQQRDLALRDRATQQLALVDSALARLAELLFKYLVEEQQREAPIVAETLWRDWQRGGRSDRPEFLRAWIDDKAQSAATRRRVSGLKRQARHLVSVSADASGSDPKTGRATAE